MVFVDLDGTLMNTVGPSIDDHLPAPLKGSALVTNALFTFCDIFNLKKQYVVDQVLSGRKFEINKPVLDWMNLCCDKGIEVTVLTGNKGISHIGVCEFKVQYTDNKALYVRKWQLQNPEEWGGLLDDSIRGALSFLVNGTDGYMLYINGHNAAAAHLLKPFIRTVTDASLKDLVRSGGEHDRGRSAMPARKVTA